MNPEQKIQLANLIIGAIDACKESKEVPVHVGHLNKTIGQNGFKKAEPGTVVYELNERYFINLESLDGKLNLQVAYYKKTLSHAIDFI